jgi:hypothetical protein
MNDWPSRDGKEGTTCRQGGGRAADEGVAKWVTSLGGDSRDVSSGLRVFGLSALLIRLYAPYTG